MLFVQFFFLIVLVFILFAEQGIISFDRIPFIGRTNAVNKYIFFFFDKRPTTFMFSWKWFSV